MKNCTLLLVLALTGCSFFQPTNELRVTEYSGSYMTAALAGCRVTGEKEPAGCVVVATEHCAYRSAACPATGEAPATLRPPQP